MYRVLFYGRFMEHTVDFGLSSVDAPNSSGLRPVEDTNKLIIGNWKMHGSRIENELRFSALRRQLMTGLRGVDVAMCVPFPYLAQAEISMSDSGLEWGVQDISAYSYGAYTGEVSAAMAREFGCRYAIVGHSERRMYHSEFSSVIAEKSRRAIENGMTPIVCVGETLEQREAGLTEKIVGTQIEEVFDLLPNEAARHIVVAYEPIWAIGTGKAASAIEAQETHLFIRNLLVKRDPALATVPILYGGSVKAKSSAALFEQPDIDGALVGGASLDPVEFAAICQAARGDTKR